MNTKRDSQPIQATLINQEVAALIDRAESDACDMSFLIKSALRDFDDDPQTAFALMRSVDMFSDRIFESLTKATNQLKPQDNEKGSAS